MGPREVSCEVRNFILPVLYSCSFPNPHIFHTEGGVTKICRTFKRLKQHPEAGGNGVLRQRVRRLGTACQNSINKMRYMKDGKCGSFERLMTGLDL